MMQQTITLNTAKEVYIDLNRGLITMITEKQLKILDAFRKNLGKKLTAEEIIEISKINSRSLLYRSLNKCLKEKVITAETIGKSILYALEVNDKSAMYLGLVRTELYALPESALQHITQEITKETPFFIGLVFGSYAKGTNKKGSDLDIAIIVPDKKEINDAEIALGTVKRREIIELHTHVFSLEEFKEMLTIDQENVGKEIFRHHFTFYNASSFYHLVKPWINLQSSI